MLKRICIFCGSSSGNSDVYRVAAQTVGKIIADNGVGVVYGGGSVGLMGVLADAVLEAGGEIIGVIPKALFDKELGHSSLHRLHIVETMHERKSMMSDLADAYLALPGGFGTYEEFFEVLTWSQLGIHAKPIGILNVNGYYDALLAMCDHAVAEGFIRREDKARIITHEHPEVLFDLILSTPVPTTTKWMRPAQT